MLKGDKLRKKIESIDQRLWCEWTFATMFRDLSTRFSKKIARLTAEYFQEQALLVAIARKKFPLELGTDERLRVMLGEHTYEQFMQAGDLSFELATVPETPETGSCKLPLARTV